eukprot:9978746-Heterocapsa_arctica.AAC.1
MLLRCLLLLIIFYILNIVSITFLLIHILLYGLAASVAQQPRHSTASGPSRSSPSRSRAADMTGSAPSAHDVRSSPARPVQRQSSCAPQCRCRRSSGLRYQFGTSG